MSNMSYCRFENTLPDLQDCRDALGDGLDGLSVSERLAARELVQMCKQIATEFGEDV